MWIPREIEAELIATARSRPAIVLTGARQSGKTSLFQRLFPTHHYISLDIPTIAEKAEFNGQEFLAEHSPPLIIDEVQYAPTLLHYIKADIDAHRDERGRYLITGSQKFSLMQGISESLAGRSSVISLQSLSAREFQSWSGEQLKGQKLFQWIFSGGYPELLAYNLDPQRFYGDYLVTYLERDVRSLLQVRSLRDFDRFIRLCASRTGQLLSLNSMATDLGISPNTVKSWLAILEASQIVFLLEPYFQNIGKRIIKTPKLYFLDTGLACYLLGIRSSKHLQESTLLGALFETHVLGQLVRHFANQGRLVPLYFFRDHYGREVDFIIPSGDRFELIESKWSERPSVQNRGFEAFESRVTPKQILSKIIVTPVPGLRRTNTNVLVGDSIDLPFLK